MPDKITTLHPKGDLATNVYPNIKQENIPNDAITTDKIVNSAVTESKIANNSVTENKIANASISSVKIKNNAIENAKIKNLAIDSSKLANNSVTTDKINNDAVTEYKIADESVTNSKLSIAIQNLLSEIVPLQIISGDDISSVLLFLVTTTNLYSYYYKFGNICHLHLKFSVDENVNANQPLATISSNYRPPESLIVTGTIATNQATMTIVTYSGELTAYSAISSGEIVCCDFEWIEL